jgi:hypothetical protein
MMFVCKANRVSLSVCLSLVLIPNSAKFLPCECVRLYLI